MEAVDLLCSRNARPQKALVGRAQWEINQPPFLRNNEHAWRDGEEWPGALLARRTEEGMETDDLLCSRNARSRAPLVGRAQWETI